MMDVGHWVSGGREWSLGEFWVPLAGMGLWIFWIWRRCWILCCPPPVLYGGWFLWRLAGAHGLDLSRRMRKN